MSVIYEVPIQSGYFVQLLLVFFEYQVDLSSNIGNVSLCSAVNLNIM